MTIKEGRAPYHIWCNDMLDVLLVGENLAAGFSDYVWRDDIEYTKLTEGGLEVLRKKYRGMNNAATRDFSRLVKEHPVRPIDNTKAPRMAQSEMDWLP